MDSKQRDLPKEEPGSSSADELSSSASRVALPDSSDEEVAVLVRRSARPKPHNPFVAKAKESLHKAFKKTPKPKLITPDSRRESSASGSSASDGGDSSKARPANTEPSAAKKAPLPAQTEEPVLLVEREQKRRSASSESVGASGKADPAPSSRAPQVQERQSASAPVEPPLGASVSGSRPLSPIARAQGSNSGKQQLPENRGASPQTRTEQESSAQAPSASSGEQQVFKRRAASPRSSAKEKSSKQAQISTSGEQQVFKRRQGAVQGKRKRKQYPRAAAKESELGLSWWHSIWSRSAWIGRVLWIGAFGCAWVALSRCMDPSVSDPELSQVPYYALMGWLFCAGLALNRNIPSRFRWSALALGLANSAALALAWNFRLDQL